MLTLMQISEEFRVPITKLKKMEAAGLFRAVREPTDAEQILAALKNGNPLSSRQLALALRQPALLDKLGEYKSDARKHIKALGDAMGEHFGARAALLVINAAKRDPSASAELASLIAARIPVEGCGYHHIAVRIGLGVDDDFLDVTFQHMARAIQQARKEPALEGMSETIERTTRFFQRAQIFDL